MTLITAMGALTLYLAFHVLCIVLFYRWVIPYDRKKILWDEHPPPSLTFTFSPLFLAVGLIYKALVIIDDHTSAFGEWIEKGSLKHWEKIDD